jgi:hypothetical protein
MYGETPCLVECFNGGAHFVLFILTHERLIMSIITPRHREREKIAPTTYDFLRTTYQSDGVTVRTGPDEVVATYSQNYDGEVMDDLVIDHFARRIANGEIINFPCTYRRAYRQVDGYGSIDGTNKVPGAGYPFKFREACTARLLDNGGFTWLGKGPEIPSVSTLEARAKLLAVANLDSTPYAFGEDTLEIKETLRFLKNPLGGILQGVRSFERKRKRYKLSTFEKVERRADALTNLWLEYQFAAAPLYRSICDALDAYVIGNRALPKRLTARGFSHDSGETNGTWTTGVSPNYDSFEYRVKRETECHAGILYEVTNPVRDWRFTLGFRMKDLPTTFWQVVPLSFMLDRVIDVSNFSKGALNLADPKVKILTGFVRSKTYYDNNVRWASGERYNQTMSGSGETIYEGNFSYVRTPWKPTIRDTIPSVNTLGLVDSATKILDLCGLIYRPMKRWFQQQ